MKKKMIGAGIAVVLMVLTALPTNANRNTSIEDAAKIAEDTLMGREGLAGVSYTETPAKITVYVENEEYASLVPDHIAGFDTEIDVSGRFYALGSAMYQSEVQSVESQQGGSPLPLLSRTVHWPFMLGGISFGNAFGTGTLGVVTNVNRLVTNAHVIALDSNANFLPTGTNTRVYQPGRIDSGPVNVGYLAAYITLRFGSASQTNPNYADAAYAICTHGLVLTKQVLNSNNANWYTVSLTTTSPSVGQMVRKSGRTTGVTQNTVHATSASVDVWYTSTKYAHFHDVLMVHQPFSSGGDSGSFVDRSGLFVGLVFAGSSDYSCVCKGSYVKSGLGIS
jgi:hypothetical protein